MSHGALVLHNEFTISIDATESFKTGNVFIMQYLPQDSLVLVTESVYGVKSVAIPSPNLLNYASF